MCMYVLIYLSYRKAALFGPHWPKDEGEGLDKEGLERESSRGLFFILASHEKHFDSLINVVVI
jgi:hypothetical protein